MYGLDDIDRSILYHLSRDARRNSATDIADHVRVSAQTVRNRIKQLEESGVIKGYHPQIDYERADGLLTNLFMCTTSASDRERLARQALQIPGVVNIREIMTGHTDLRITAIGQDTDEISQIARVITDLGIAIEEESGATLGGSTGFTLGGSYQDGSGNVNATGATAYIPSIAAPNE